MRFFEPFLVFGALMPCLNQATAEPIDYQLVERVNISGRQRMLSQMMTKASCLAMVGIDPAAHAEQSEKAADEFDAALRLLRDGDPARGFSSETATDILAALSEGQALWDTFGPAVRQLYSGDLHNVVISQVLDLNLPVLASMNRIVGLIDKSGGDGGNKGPMAATVDMAGRQRMLSQKMIKELCLIHAEIETVKQRADLKASMDLFDNSLHQLMRGDEAQNIVGPPNPEVAAHLEEAAAAWADLRRVIEPVSQGTAPSRLDVEGAARISMELLTASHKAVVSYL